MSKQGTVVEQKQLFLRSRKHILSRGITPSERLLTIAKDGGIELSVLKGVLSKVNRNLKQHSRKVYSRQMIEHVVEQIDTLYWESGTKQIDDEEEEEEEEEEADTEVDLTYNADLPYRSDDLTLDSNIAKLPVVWPGTSQAPDVNQDTYLDAISRLQDLSSQRLVLQSNLKTTQTLLSLLEPYRKPKENIQPNLVWKDAPLAPELAKTRTLAMRVTGRVGERLGDVQVPSTADEDGDIDMDGLKDGRKKKVDSVLDTW